MKSKSSPKEIPDVGCYHLAASMSLRTPISNFDVVLNSRRSSWLTISSSEEPALIN